MAWTFAVLGNDIAAAYCCLQASELDDKGRTSLNRLLWSALQANLAGGPKALLSLLKLAATKEGGPLFIGVALGALVAQNREAEIDYAVASYIAQHPLPVFMERRLRVEPLLAARKPELKEKARDDLISLLDLPDIPALHQAEICYNIGYAYERLQHAAEAEPWYQRARKANPHLTLAAEALARFAKPQVPDPVDEALGLQASEELSNDGGEP